MATSVRPERVEKVVSTLRQWQGLERQALSDTAEIMEGTKSPLLRLMMEIIRHDSLMHHRVQQFLVDSLTLADVAVTRDELATRWSGRPSSWRRSSRRSPGLPCSVGCSTT